MFAVAIAGLLLSVTSEVSSHSRQREKEKELLYVGDQFREAIALYYQRTPGTVKRYPEKLEELLERQALPQHAALPEEGPRRPHDRKVPVGNHRRAGGGINGRIQASRTSARSNLRTSMPGMRPFPEACGTRIGSFSNEPPVSSAAAHQGRSTRRTSRGRNETVIPLPNQQRDRNL